MVVEYDIGALKGDLRRALTYDNALISFVAGLATWFLYKIFFAPLHDIPGPFITRFTKFWFFHRVLYGSKLNWDTLRLHQKYGKVVRLGPNHVSISDDADVQSVYGGHPAFPKSKWYDAFLPPNGANNLFTDRNNERHAQLRRQYSQRMREMGDKQFDLTWWSYCYAADTVSKVLFSKRFGYMDNGEDIGGHSKWVYKNMVYGTYVGIVDGLNFKVWKVMELLGKIGIKIPHPPAFLMDFTFGAIHKRREERKAGHHKSPDANGSIDLMDKMINAHENDPKTFPETNIFSGLVIGVVAGADTTSTSITATLYYLLKNPAAMARLRAELSTLSRPADSTHFAFKDVQALPFLEAVIREGMRLCPGGANSFEREVPAGGLRLVSGQFLPAGTVIGVNALISQYSEDAFGPDAATFRPERWLDADKDQLAQMNRHWVGFGLGARNCLGRHLLTRFEFELVDKDHKLDMKCYTVVYIDEIPVRVKELYENRQDVYCL
ncbi:cytochrome P450 [Trichoderma pleuroticola]